MTERPFTWTWHLDGQACPHSQSLKHGQPQPIFVAAPREAAQTKTELRLTIPLACINGIWSLYGDRTTLLKVTGSGYQAATPYYKPGLLAFVDRDLCSRLLLITTPPEAEAVISWQISQAEACYHLKIEWTHAPVARELGLWLSSEVAPVHDLAHRMVERVVPKPSEPQPQPSFEPSYCTWYACHASLEQKRVELYARRARELGFGAFILDDGWMYDTDQRSPGQHGPWFRLHGDYEPSRRKFPDFGGLVQSLHALDLRFILWVAPYIVGTESRSYRKLADHLLPSWLDEGFRAADPRSPAVASHLEETLTRLVRDYPIDGFKVDYDYGLLGPDQMPSGTGSAYLAATRRLIEGVRKINPQFEWNLCLSAGTRTLSNAFRCVDVPFDPESNRLAMASFKAMTPGLPLHYDPSLWSADEPVEIVHRHIVPSLFCVPSLGADILNLPQEHLDAIRGWLGFYRHHQFLLNHGTFSPVWAGGDYQSFHVRGNNQEIAAVFSDFPVRIGASAQTWMINNSSSPEMTLISDRKTEIAKEDTSGALKNAPETLATGCHRVACRPGDILRIQG